MSRKRSDPLEPPHHSQVMRNGGFTLSDHKFYFFFTVAVHFGDVAIVYLPRRH
jgi:hypothetical protein